MWNVQKNTNKTKWAEQNGCIHYPLHVDKIILNTDSGAGTEWKFADNTHI